PVRVADHGDRPGIDRQGDGWPLALARRLLDIERLTGQVAQVETLLLEREPSEADARDVQQVVEQPRQVPRLPAQDLEQPRAIGLARALQSLEPVRHRAERIAQLVRQHGEKLVAMALLGLERLEQARRVEGERDAKPDVLKESHIRVAIA